MSLYRNILQKSPIGYALHKRICEDNESEAYYKVEETNTAFSTIVGLNKKGIIGARSQDVLSSNSMNKILDRDVHIATHRYEREVRFKYYSQALKKYYTVTAYKEQEGYIVTFLHEYVEDKLCDNYSVNDIQKLNHCEILVNTIMNALFEKNNREMRHSQRVGSLCEAIARRLGLEMEEVSKIKNAGLLHDIGKIAVSNSVLDKTGPLNELEWAEIRGHSISGYNILCGTLTFSDVASFILDHHERLDGSGYPNGKKGTEISLGARIIAVADSFDAMISPRPYCQAKREEEALLNLQACADAYFDADVIQVLVELVGRNEWKASAIL
ncbi:HD-GYP domain-containing protein [Clostridia bacterium]|nr:HD-GYP domain-containing protein [Clostridia bacterium]